MLSPFIKFPSEKEIVGKTKKNKKFLNNMLVHRILKFTPRATLLKCLYWSTAELVKIAYLKVVVILKDCRKNLMLSIKTL